MTALALALVSFSESALSHQSAPSPGISGNSRAAVEAKNLSA
jgi:hypothetical protein